MSCTRLLPHSALRLALVAVMMAAALVVITPSVATAAPRTGIFVALGDSYAAGAGIPDSSGGLCARSDHNYGSLVAARIQHPDYRDVSCAAAKIRHLTASQSSPFGGTLNDPQLNALSADTTLVTLTIGGNDLGTSDLGFGEVIASCIAGAAVNPIGTPCKDVYAHGHWEWSPVWYNWSRWVWVYGDDDLVARINAAAPRLASALREIHNRAPQAKVVVVGYPSILPSDGWDCLGRLPATVGDVSYLHGIVGELNAMLARTAFANGAIYVNTATPTRGHDVCSDDPWIEGAVPSSPTVPFHPNAQGEQVMADAVISAIAAP